MYKNFAKASVYSCLFFSIFQTNTYAAPLNCSYNQLETKSLKLTAALSLLNKLGEKKPNQQNKPLIIGKIEVDHSLVNKQLNHINCTNETNEVTYLILRTLMRNPSEQSLVMLYAIHKIFQQVIPKDDLTLNWILGGLKSPKEIKKTANYDYIVPEESGAFVARTNWNSADDLKKFLMDNPHNMNSSKLIGGIEGILASLAYRSIFADWVEEPQPSFYPIPLYGSEREQFKNLLIDITQKWRVPTVASLYFDRDNEKAVPNIDTSHYYAKNTILADYNNDLSEVSDDESTNLLSSQKRKRLPKPAFYNQIQKNAKMLVTWPYSAHKAGLAVRANVSGTAPLALSILVAFANEYKTQELTSLIWNPAQFLLFKNEIQKLGSLIFVPNYERSDYHTVAETFVGITYYCYKLNEIRLDSLHNIPLEEGLLHPIDSYKQAMNNLSQMASESKFDIILTDHSNISMSPAEAIQIVLNELIIPKIEANRIEFETSKN